MNTESYWAGTSTSGIGDALQANWVPLSMIGIGIAWLVAGNTGLADRVAKDERVQAAGHKIGEIAGDLGIGGAGSNQTGPGAQILGPDGEPLSRDGDSDHSNGWVHQVAGAARSTQLSPRRRQCRARSRQ